MSSDLNFGKSWPHLRRHCPESQAGRMSTAGLGRDKLLQIGVGVCFTPKAAQSRHTPRRFAFNCL
jgi:hypothetical protein